MLFELVREINIPCMLKLGRVCSTSFEVEPNAESAFLHNTSELDVLRVLVTLEPQFITLVLQLF